MEANNDKHTHELQHALAYAENIIATLREPFVVLDKSLRVRTANAAFYRDFHVSKEETEGRFVYDLGNGQWDIPQLRTLLSQVLSNSHPVEDFEVEHAFPALGRRNMLLNARRFPPESNDPDLVLLAIEDVTDRRRAEAAMKHSEVRYRRLFQTAKDGILILDADTGKVIDANPFMTDLLGYSHDEFLGKELWEIGLFRRHRGEPGRLPGTAREGLRPLRAFAAGKQKRAEGRSRVRQQRLCGGPSPSRSMQHP